MRFNKPTRLDAGIFLVSFAVLLLELLLTRIFSVTLFYHLSFMVVSLAMLGFAAGGLAANLWSNRFRESALLGQLSVLSLLFALTNLLGAPTAVLIGSVAGAGAAIVFAKDESRPLLRASCLALVLFLLAIVANARWNFLDVTVAKGRQQPPTLATKWNSFSRVDVETLGQ